MIRRDWLKSLAGALGLGLTGGATKLLADAEALPTGKTPWPASVPQALTEDEVSLQASLKKLLDRSCGGVVRPINGVYPVGDGMLMEVVGPQLRMLPPVVFLDIEGAGPDQKMIKRIFEERAAGRQQPGILPAPFEPVKPKPIPQYTPCNVALKHEPVKGEAGRFFEIITQTEAELLNDRRKALHDGRGWLTQQAPGPLLNVDGLDDEECVDLGISAVKQRMRQLIDEWDGTPDDELGERLREFADPYV